MVGAYAAVVAALGWRSRGWPLAHDAPLMHYIAWRIGEGAVPYRDLFDMNVPGGYLIHWAVMALLGEGDVAWRSFDLAWLAAGAAAAAALAARWGAVSAAGAALLFALFHLAAGPWQTGQRDFLLCPLVLLAGLATARILEGRAAGGAALGAGLALGAALTIKPPALLLVGALGAVLVLAGRPPHGRRLLAFAAGLAVIPLAVFGWMLAVGAVPAWWSLVLDYLLPLYTRLGEPGRWRFVQWRLWLPLLAAVALGVLATVSRGGLGPRHAVTLVGFGYGVGHFVGQAKGWEYHTYPAAAFASVLAFAGLGPALRQRRWTVALPLAGALALVLVVLAGKGAEAATWAEGGWITAKVRRVERIVAALERRRGPGDLIQVLDTTEGGLHALLRLRARQPTRFLYDFHFFHDVDHPVIRALRAELIAGLDARPPRFVVLFLRAWPTGGPERLERFPALRDRLAAGYAELERGEGYVIYAKRDRP